MALCTIAGSLIADALVGGTSYTKFNNANAALGVGDSSTAFDAGQTDLQAATNKLRKGQDVSYPSVSTNAITFRSTFSTSEANWAWNEWGVFNATSGNQMLSRKVESLGTKTVAATWQLTCTLTLSIS